MPSPPDGHGIHQLITELYKRQDEILRGQSKLSDTMLEQHRKLEKTLSAVCDNGIHAHVNEHHKIMTPTHDIVHNWLGVWYRRSLSFGDTIMKAIAMFAMLALATGITTIIYHEVSKNSITQTQGVKP